MRTKKNAYNEFLANLQCPWFCALRHAKGENIPDREVTEPVGGFLLRKGVTDGDDTEVSHFSWRATML